ncbi:MAG: hypothetical protein M5U22_06535 [Thermoleophilia bacterium]|nr:hypothetical protein [Thermoleophilia bacterium]
MVTPAMSAVTPGLFGLAAASVTGVREAALVFALIGILNGYIYARRERAWHLLLRDGE